MWLAFLTRHDLLNKDKLPKELNNMNLKKALTVLDVMNFSESEREILEGSGRPLARMGRPNPPLVYCVWMVARFAPAHQPPQLGAFGPRLAAVVFAVKRR